MQQRRPSQAYTPCSLSSSGDLDSRCRRLTAPARLVIHSSTSAPLSGRPWYGSLVLSVSKRADPAGKAPCRPGGVASLSAHLIAPHGGALVDLFADPARAAEITAASRDWPSHVRPNLIRVESDEATYNLHIMLRFDLERAMIRGDLAVADLPGVWNDRIKSDLGLDVPDDARGCLQDVHWSMGSVGYFPTYTLGNLYSAQLWDAIVVAIPDVDQQMQRGEFAALLGWLRDNVHAHGRRFPAPELARRVTGHPLGSTSLLRYLDAKLRPLYRL